MNVLFFITDQQRADHLGCAGNPILKTPHIDRLAGEGMRFRRAYVANPTCMPNRASIMTGLYPNMCVRSFGVNLPEHIPTFSGVLREQGYVTKAIGKMHLHFWSNKVDKSHRSAEYLNGWVSEKTHPRMVENFPKPFYGFDEVDLVVGHGDCCNGHYQDWLAERAPEYIPVIRQLGGKLLSDIYRRSPIPEDLYPTSYITDRAVDFLERYGKGDYGEKPFFLKVSYPDPHHPCTPPGKYAEMYKPADMELPPSFQDLEAIKHHKFIGSRRDHPFLGKMMLRTSKEEETRNFISHTYGMITMIDDSVGQILATLDRLGFTDDTMIIYTSDHGDMMGDHGLILKGPLPFNGILNVPLIWKVPGLTKAGSVSEALVSAVDLAPSILNLCPIDPEALPPDMQGVDITPVLKDPGLKVRDCCFIEIDEADNGLARAMPIVTEAFGNMEMRIKYLVTERYSLTLYNGLKNYGDLFDRRNDPEERNNLWFSNPELRYELIEKLLHEMINTQDLYPKKQAMA